MEKLLEIWCDMAPVSWCTVTKECKRHAVEIAEAMLVWVMTVISSVLTAHPQVPLACMQRHTENKRTE